MKNAINAVTDFAKTVFGARWIVGVELNPYRWRMVARANYTALSSDIEAYIVVGPLTLAIDSI